MSSPPASVSKADFSSVGKTGCKNDGQGVGDTVEFTGLVDRAVASALLEVTSSVGSYSSSLQGGKGSQDGVEICQKILSKEVTLLSLIEHLGPHLTSTEIQKRAAAMDVLARVFSAFPRDFLTEKELEFVLEFLCNRINDQHLVIPKVILCCLPIVRCTNLPPGSGSRLLVHIFRETNIQSHPQRIRHAFFQIVDFLVRNKLQEATSMQTDFVINFLQAIDGEKDPRNLLLLFQLIPLIMSNFDLGPFFEDFFEVLACYFPIDFSPTGTAEITRDMLSGSLHNCLAHSTQFVPFLLPLTLEKLDSSLPDAKVDSLKLLTLCCEKNYEPGHLQHYLAQLWHSLRREIFMGESEAVENLSISLIQSVFKVVSSDEQVLNTCVELIFAECRHHLSEPELRLINPASKILLAMCLASEKSFVAVAPKLLQDLNDHLTKTAVTREKKKIMDIIEKVLATSQLYPQIRLSDLVDHWDEMIATWFTFIACNNGQDPDFSILALKIIGQIVDRSDDFAPKDRQILQAHMIALLESGVTENSSSLRQTITSLAVKLVRIGGGEVLSVLVPKLLENLSLEAKKDVMLDALSLSSEILSSCAAYEPNVFQTIVSSLLDKIEEDSGPTSARLKFAICLNRIMQVVIIVKGKDELIDMAALGAILLKELTAFDRIFTIALAEAEIGITTHVDQLLKNNFFKETISLLRNFMRIADSDLQQGVVDKFWKGRVKEDPWEEALATTPFPIVEAILGAVIPSAVGVHRMNDFQDFLLHNFLSVSKTEAATENKAINILICQRLFASLLNKMESESDFKTLLEKIGQIMDAGMSPFYCGNAVGNADHNVEPTIMETEAVHSLCWVTKALAMRGYPFLNVWVDKILKLLYNERIGSEAAECFEILMADDPISLNVESHCRVRFLYKQRLFQMTTPKLILGYREAKSNSTKSNFIQALSAQLKYIPHEVLAMELDSVFPLLVGSLKLESSSEMIHSTLKALAEIVKDEKANEDGEIKKKLVEYCYDLIPELVKLAKYPDTMEVRILALQSLQKCAGCPPPVILPLRQKTALANAWMTIKDCAEGKLGMRGVCGSWCLPLEEFSRQSNSSSHSLKDLKHRLKDTRLRSLKEEVMAGIDTDFD